VPLRGPHDYHRVLLLYLLSHHAKSSCSSSIGRVDDAVGEDLMGFLSCLALPRFGRSKGCGLGEKV